jgi:GDP-4-dehydro-6-deoxy-D-mannose reductase
MRILITGINGFVGGHLLERLTAEAGHRILGYSRSGSWSPNHRHLADCAELVRVDLLDVPALTESIRSFQPERVYHLAGFASPGKSFKDPETCWAENFQATRNLLDAVDTAARDCRVLMVSSGLVYGDAKGPDDAFDESRPLRPASPYAESKAAADRIAEVAANDRGLHVVRVRPFNHIGPRQSADYAVGNFARQVAAIVQGKSEPIIETGDLSARRDLTDVRDVVEAYVLALERGPSGEVYNVGRGIAYGMDEILHWFIDRAGVAVEVHSRTDAFRKGDTAVTRCDAGKIRRELGWQPRYDLGQTVNDILNYWLASPPQD